MIHAAPEWAFKPNYLINLLQVVQNKALRILGAYAYDIRRQIRFNNEILILKAYAKYLA